MNHGLGKYLVALAALCSLGFSVHARADISISGSISSTGVFTVISPTLISQNFSGIGVDSAFGAFVSHTSFDRDISDLANQIISNGIFTAKFAQGDLFATFIGSGGLTGPGAASFTNTLTFTGGTGIFAGATGSANGSGTFVLTSPTTAAGESSYEGSVTLLVPEPGAALLLAAGLSGAALLLRRKRGR